MNKTITFNYKKKKISIASSILPNIRDNECIIKSEYTFISLGTEKNIVNTTKKSLLKTALDRPDLLSRVIRKFKEEGFSSTFKQIEARLDVSKPLGYSASGIIDSCGKKSNFKIGDKVCLIGNNIGSHSTFNIAKSNNIIKIPNGISLLEASCAGVACISLNAIKKANLEITEKILILGLGLLGQFAIKIAHAEKTFVYGYDIDPVKIDITKKNNEFIKIITDKNLESYESFFDKVFIFASSNNNKPIEIASKLTRKEGLIISVGLTNLNIPRDIFFEKELNFFVSRSWAKENDNSSLKNNVDNFFRYLLDKKINIDYLLENKLDFNESENFFNNDIYNYKNISLVISYDKISKKFEKNTNLNKPINKIIKKTTTKTISIYGCGLFVKSFLLPNLKKIVNSDFFEINLHTRNFLEAEELKKKYNIKKILNSEDHNINCDYVFIANRHSSHSLLLEKFLDQKVNIFCEKPLCININELTKIKQNINDFNNKFFLGYNRRFSEQALIIKKYLNENHLCINFLQINLNLPKIDNSHWIYRNEEGGGRMISECCHYLDFANFLQSSLITDFQVLPINVKNSHITDNFILNFNHSNYSKTSINLNTSDSNCFYREQYIIRCEGDINIILNDFVELNIFKKNKRIYRNKNLKKDLGYSNIIQQFLGLKDNYFFNHKEFISSILNSTEIILKADQNLKS